MKVFTAILFGTLIVASFAEDTVAKPDTSYIGNTVKVEIQSATKQADDEIEQKRRLVNLSLQARLADATEKGVSYTFWGVVLSLIIGAFSLMTAVGSVIIARLAHQSSKDQWVASRDATKVEVRAYVVVRPVIDSLVNVLNPTIFTPNKDYPAKIVDASTGPGIQMRTKNMGKTVAKEVLVFTGFKVDHIKRPENLSVESLIDQRADWYMTKSSMLPGETMTEPRGSASRLSELDVEGIRSSPKDPSAKALYIYGAAIYRDIFGDCWQSNFRFMYANILNGPVPEHNSVFPCSDGNEEKACETKTIESLKQFGFSAS